jgi:hypothetical protein
MPLARTTEQVVGAWPNGSRVVKGIEPAVNGRLHPSAHKEGDKGTILGSRVIGGRTSYCVIWDDMPEVPVWVFDFPGRLVRE